MGGLIIEFNLEELGWCLFATVSHLLTWELRYSLKAGAIESGADFKVRIVVDNHQILVVDNHQILLGG